ncbi:MAG TPA: response regulator [Actinomycetota bacterium]
MNKHILVAEDDPQHAELILEAFSAAKIANPVLVCKDGAEAIAHLSEEALQPGADGVPSLLLLDLHLPRRSGLEVLEWVKDQRHLKFVPVVMLTSSREAEDMTKAYELGANSYLVKPVGFDALVQVIRTLGMYWLVLNQKPAPERS